LIVDILQGIILAEVLRDALAQSEKPQDREDDHDDANDVDDAVHGSPCEWGPGLHGVHNAIHDILMPTVPFFDAPCQHQNPGFTPGLLIIFSFTSPLFPTF
jgi:hypothetical protein